MVCSQQLLTALKKPQANHASDPCDQIEDDGRWLLNQAFSTIVTRPCAENKQASLRVPVGLVTS